MAELILVRGIHPNERSAKYFTPKIAAKLRELGHQVIEISIPNEETIYFALKHATEEKPPVFNEAAEPFFTEQILNRLLKLRKEHPDAIIIDVHNSPYFPDSLSTLKKPVALKKHDYRQVRHNEDHLPVPRGRDPFYQTSNPNMLKPDPIHYSIEIPAEYAHDSSAEQKIAELLEVFGKNEMQNWSILTRLDYLRPVDLKQTQAQGLLGDEMADVIARGIHEQIIPHHEATKK